MCKRIIIIVCVLIRVAFLTLFEQKVLSFSQIRPGPQKTGIKGILQPFADGLKLFTKESILPQPSLKKLFTIPPCLILSFILVLTLVLPHPFSSLNVNLTLLFVMAILSVGVYFTFMSGLFSSSKYSMLGGIRGVAQTISYEIGFFTILLVIVVVSGSYAIKDVFSPVNPPIIVALPAVASFWFISTLAETCRAPFDFREGESELVSGFNTEYGASPFALFFIGEYGFIIIMRVLIRALFMRGWSQNYFFFISLTRITFLFIWVRTTLPRLRFDILITFAWTDLLPISLIILSLVWVISTLFF